MLWVWMARRRGGCGRFVGWADSTRGTTTRDLVHDMANSGQATSVVGAETGQADRARAGGWRLVVAVG
jgi:hypothetical protein